MVALYAEGRIHGAEAFGELPPGFRSMAHDRTPADHPLLEVWRQQLARLHLLVLEPDTYFIQIDGYAGDGGPWQLEVFSVEP